MRHCLHLLFFAVSALLWQSQHNFANARTTERLFDLLPREARIQISATRQFCKEAGAAAPQSVDDGLSSIDLNGDGSRDILLDWQYIACGVAGGGGCSNRGCDLEIYK